MLLVYVVAKQLAKLESDLHLRDCREWTGLERHIVGVIKP